MQGTYSYTLVGMLDFLSKLSERRTRHGLLEPDEHEMCVNWVVTMHVTPERGESFKKRIKGVEYVDFSKN